MYVASINGFDDEVQVYVISIFELTTVKQSNLKDICIMSVNY